MVLSHPSTPQHRTAPRSLWPSPAFSDYFSGNDDNNSPTVVDGPKLALTPLQQRILLRLNEIGQQVVRANPEDQTPSILEAELDHIEQRLNAPESQSRAPAEMAASGLFIDDEDADDDMEESTVGDDATHKARELQEGREVVARISKVTEQLQDRCADLHNINELAISRLQSATDEIIGLRSENEYFHRDLSDIYNTMLALKMQLSMLELEAAPYLNSEAGRSLRKDVERWKLDWRIVERRLDSRRHLYEPTNPDTLPGSENGFGNGMSSSMHSSVDLSPPVYRSKLKIKRPGLITKPIPDPFVDHQAGILVDHISDKWSDLSTGTAESINHENTARKDSKVERFSTDDEVLISDDETLLPLEEQPNDEREADDEVGQEHAADNEVQESEEVPRKSAWQELWDGLTEYAGILDYSD